MPAVKTTPTVELAPITKRSYYTNGSKLYYIIDIMPDGSHALVENCRTNKSKWMKISILQRANLDPVAVGLLEKEAPV